MKTVKKVVLILLGILVAAAYSYGVWPRAIYNTDISTGLYEDTGALDEINVYEQRFVCEDSGLCGIVIKLTKMEKPTIGSYEWYVSECESGKVVGTGVIDEAATENKVFESSSTLKKGNLTLDFSRQKDSKGKEYLLSIRPEQVSDNETMAVYITDKGETLSELTIGGRTSDKTGVIKLRYQRFNVETFIVFIGILVYFVVFIRFLYRLFR